MTGPVHPADAPTVLEAMATHVDRPALVAGGAVHGFDDVQHAAAAVAADLLQGHASLDDTGLAPSLDDSGLAPSLDEARVAILSEATPDYVAALLGTWMAGGLAVPIRPGVPRPEIDRVMEDAAPSVVLHDAANADALAHLDDVPGIDRRVVAFDPHPRATPPPAPSAEAGALMIYTSGTTGRPKGVVHTHRSLAAQVQAMRTAWAWSPDDRIPLVLPLHHVHGIVNVLCCALASGATCEMHPRLDPVQVWETFAAGDTTLFMAVPTIYGRLLQAWDDADEDDRGRWADGARGLRLMVSGSAALPVDMLERWEEVTGQRLLERYGMSEVGMALSNTLDERVPGTVGHPLPGVRARLVDDDGAVLEGDVTSGHLQLQGPALFREYWRRPEETRDAFVDGWFDTGDDAARQDGRYRMLGRSSVDILKTGGEKVSALEVEFVYRTHDQVDDIAVVGVPDPTWGQRVCAAVVPASAALDLETLRAWGKDRLVDYKVPREFLVVDDLPRNAMGKVTKPAVAELFA